MTQAQYVNRPLDLNYTCLRANTCGVRTIGLFMAEIPGANKWKGYVGNPHLVIFSSLAWSTIMNDHNLDSDY